ncbi:MAG: proprotein convertase P-domain-containing protein [Saprospiraceae bacterium]|nr:proprotein convertase P-domain-containing protein [Saprospiraceae bacterium]
MNKLLWFFLIFPGVLHAQNYLMNGNPITDCSGTFYDPGGPAGNYPNNQNLVTTICSDGSNGTHIRLSFSGAALGPGDVLCFYDGPTAASPLLSCAADYPPGEPFVVQATAANPTGCLTITFQSDGSGTGSGWAAAISCVTSCQTVLADLVSTNPQMIPADTGWIDICPGERVFFNGTGFYPQNDFAYHQSDFNTIFEWNFGDGGIAYGPNTSHRFDQPGGYFVQLTLTDTLGCKSSNLISQRIRVAPRPDFNLATVAQICAGDTLMLGATIDTALFSHTVSVFPVTSSFSVEASRSDSLPLPDGTGELYETSIILTEFSPGQILTNENDLDHICVTIEHSWMRDIEITLTCPSGQSIILHDHPGNIGGQVFLGEPNDNDNFNPIPGLGYTYCWTPNATNPTWIQFANTVLGGTGTLPPDDYSTFDPISDLVGCPLNGEWTIGVTDLWAADNGFIFNWAIQFNEAIYPNVEAFTPQFVNWGWNNHPSIFFTSNDSIAAAPQNAGTAGYTFSVTDNFGCTWDTLLNVPVLPPTHPDCYVCNTNFPALQDAEICAGETVNFNATSLAPTTQEVRFESYPDYRFGNANHPHANPYLSPVNVNSLGYNFITNATQQITSVCMDIETDFCADLNVFLQAPGGQLLMLTTANGGGGDNYKITCFSPAATIPIVGQAAPFNGTYMPEGNWNALNGSQVNGDWSLMVSDGFAPSQFGKVKWWSIGFNTQNTINYSWNNGSSLSCQTCPNPVASPTDTTTYILTATNSYNCVHMDTAVVNIRNFFPAPTGLIVFDLGPGTMTWQWNPVPGALGYEVSVDGGPWQSPNNGFLSHIVSGVGIGQTVAISVRAISPTLCVPEVVNASSVFPNCTMFVNLFSTTDVICSGDNNGSAILSISNATFPISIFLDTISTPFPNGDLINILSEGTHTVIVLDDLGCRDTLTFSIGGPPPVQVSASGINVLCNGDNTGEVSATASGGTGNIAFIWQNCLGGPNLGGPNQQNLFAGCFNVTATDENGCTATTSVTLSEPLPFTFMTSQDSVSCNGLSDGAATITVGGGSGPYNYLWDNAQTSAAATMLDAGFHFVTVTDNNNCAATTFVQVFEPDVFFISNTQTAAAACFDANNGAASILALGGTTPYSYQWNDPAMQQTMQASNLASGVYTVTVTDWHGCTDFETLTITAPPAISVTYSGITGEICAGDCMGQATVSASGGTGNFQFLWSDPGISPGSITAVNLCPGPYTVTATDQNGCTQQAIVQIAGAVPIVVNISETDPSCSGSSDGQISVSINGGAPGYLYIWSNGATTQNIQNIPCGPYILTLTDAIGCVQQYQSSLDCPQTIVVQNITPKSVTCFGGADGEVAIQVSGGTLPLNYQWDDPQGQITPVAVNLPIGTYTVTVTDANGCNIQASATVTEPTQVLVSASATDVSCINGNNGTVMATASGGVGGYVYSWGGGQTTGLTAGTYTVTVSDLNQCTNTASVVVSQPLTPVSVNATQSRWACFGETDGEASVSASGSNGAPFSFEWSNGQTGGGASNLSPGIYTVTATDGKGCTGEQSVVIQQLDSIEVKIAYVPPTCAGDANGLVGVVLVEGGLGMGDSTQYHYAWSLLGAPDANLVYGFSGGNYFLTVSDFQGCFEVLPFQVVAPQPMTLQMDSQDISCFGANDGDAAVVSVQNAVGGVSYTWSNQESTQQIDSLAVGTYAVTATDSKGCSATASVQLEEPAQLALQFTIKQLACAGDSTGTVTALVTGGTPIYAIEWANGATTAEIDHLPAGAYPVQVTDRNGCMVIDTAVLQQPQGMALTSVVKNPKCFGSKDGQITLTVDGGKAPYKFSVNGGPFAFNNSIIALGAGDYQILITDGKGCQTDTLISLHEPPPVIVNLGPDTTVTLGDIVLLNAQVDNAVGFPKLNWTAYLLDTITCIDQPDCETVEVKPPFSNTYQVKVTDANGCMGTDDIRVNVFKPKGVYVPTGFTPNGDLENDLLVVHGKSRQVHKILMFRIYDRWGEMIYEDRGFSVNDATRGWNGTFRGQECDPGVYVWVVEAEYLDGYVEQLQGNVTLVR